VRHKGTKTRPISLSLGRLLLLTIVLLAYASLYPWQFHAYDHQSSPWLVLFHAWPARLSQSGAEDIAANVLVYLPLGFFAFAAYAAIWRTWVAAIAALATGIALSFSVEMAQFFVVGRISSVVDVASNALGAAAGIAAGSFWRTHHHASKSPLRTDAMFVIAGWVLYQMFPFFPHRGAPRLIATSPPIDAILYFTTVLALVPVIDALGGTTRRRRLTLSALVILVPLKVFILMRQVTVFELASTAAAFAIALLAPVRVRVAAAALGIAVVVHGLAPFAFQDQGQPFSWLPFQASLASDWAPALLVLLGKSFVYGSLLWLIRESGARLAVAAAAIAALLAAVEVAQIHLPGRSPEITDPVIALILAWVFWSLPPQRSVVARTLPHY
jgi:VanZ family protein